ncbi:molybdate ABC transporter permease subunit [Chitinibacter sp. S2-10]|uniref:molybdate ABC transporter permease subunit n=1 Tax=Chitinibacter sp. S2-10 TaxID=3373597 RepID=UPI003977BE2A
MFSAEDLSAIILTLKLASATTLLLLLIATPLAWWLARSSALPVKIVSALVTLPLVLPPTVIGFYLLVALGPNGPLGSIAQALGVLPFTFAGLVLASIIYSLPFAVQPIQQAFANIFAISARPLEVAATLRASPLDTFFSVALPLARPGIITAAVMSFAHTVGEFGVVLMIGGNIPHETRVVSVQIYDHVEALQYTQAHALALTMLVFSFIALLALHLLNKPVRTI